MPRAAIPDPTRVKAMADYEWSPLCATVAALLPHLDWRENGLGLLQAYLIEGVGREVRVHVWSPRLERPGMRGNGNIHDHRFDMISRVLVGAVMHGHIVPEHGGADWQMCEVVHARKAKVEKGSFDCEVERMPGLFGGRVEPYRIPAGQVYWFPQGQFHESFCDELTVTIVEKQNQRSDTPARILWPAGKELTHAFGGAPSGHAAEVLQDAAAKLRSQWDSLR